MPLVEPLRHELINGSDVLHGYDTTMSILAFKTSKSKTCRLWTYMRNELLHSGLNCRA